MPLQPSLATPRAAARTLLAALMAVAGVLHFVNAPFFERMVPPPLPPTLTTWLSGVIELLLAVGIVVPATRARAGVALVMFYVAVVPANFYMALFPAAAGAGDIAPALLWLRLPLQLVLMAWAWWCTRPEAARR